MSPWPTTSSSRRLVGSLAGALTFVTLALTSPSAHGLGADGTTTSTATGATGPSMTLATTESNVAQETTFAFDALAFATGNSCADTFYPPGNVADFFGFQYLRDNEIDGQGHNTAFAATVAQNVLELLTPAELQTLIATSRSEASLLTQYGLDRFPLIKAFEELRAGTQPSGTSLSETAVMAYSAQTLYRLDGLISLSRASGLATIINGLSSSQRDTLSELNSLPITSWPDESSSAATLTQGLSSDTETAVMDNAGELFSWFVGDLDADTYFSPERQGTYFGSFDLKDAPALLSQASGTDVTISQNLTHDYGTDFLDTLDSSQRAKIMGILDRQRPTLLSLVATRRDIARELLLYHSGTSSQRAAIRSTVLSLEARYGTLDGTISYLYATTFSAVDHTLTSSQKAHLDTLRQSSQFLGLGALTDDPCQLHPSTSAYLYSAQIAMPTAIDSSQFFQR